MTTYRWSLLEEISGCQDVGIEAIGVWRPKLEDFGEDRSIELLGESGLQVSSLSWAGGFTGANGHSFEEAVEDGYHAIRVAAALNAECLVILSGARAGHIRSHARRLLVDGLTLLADYASAFDIELALQPMHRAFAWEWTFLHTLDETLSVLDECESPSAGIAFDVYHLWQEPRLLQRIPEIAARTAVVQLSDALGAPRSDADRLLPGEGVIPLEAIIAAFLDAGYRRFFEVNVWSERVWNADYAELLAHCQRQFTPLISAGETLAQDC